MCAPGSRRYPTVKVVDDYTIDFLTKAPNPIFPDSIANFMIMSIASWAEANKTARPIRDKETYATLNANGTGAFKVALREPGIKTVLEPFAGWWGTAGTQYHPGHLRPACKSVHRRCRPVVGRNRLHQSGPVAGRAAPEIDGWHHRA